MNENLISQKPVASIDANAMQPLINSQTNSHHLSINSFKYNPSNVDYHRCIPRSTTHDISTNGKDDQNITSSTYNDIITKNLHIPSKSTHNHNNEDSRFLQGLIKLKFTILHFYYKNIMNEIKTHHSFAFSIVRIENC